MITLIDVTKRFGEFTAVDRLNLNVSQGELFGFLGPNGAGKTTTLKMMAGVLKPTGGKIIIDNKDMSEDPLECKQVIGFIPDRPFLYEKLTGREILQFIAGIYGLSQDGLEKRMKQLFELFEIGSWKDDLVESYSHGMKQRLVMVTALIHQPRVIIVDEPMVGLDPRAAKLVKKVFRSLCQRGITIFISTHTLQVAEEMCDRIGIIHQGKLIAIGTMKDLREMSGLQAKELEEVYFKLTGAEEIEESQEIEIF
jgi:ABC-2 type transport system ATP-binding protein